MIVTYYIVTDMYMQIRMSWIIKLKLVVDLDNDALNLCRQSSSWEKVSQIKLKLRD